MRLNKQAISEMKYIPLSPKYFSCKLKNKKINIEIKIKIKISL